MNIIINKIKNYVKCIIRRVFFFCSSMFFIIILFYSEISLEDLKERFKDLKYVYIQKFLNDEEIGFWEKHGEFLDYFFRNPTKRWHKFHIVSPSPWPFFVSMNLLFALLHFVPLINRDYSAIFGFYLGLFLLVLTSVFWFRDIIRESTYMGYHSIEVQMLHRTGFILFLISEIMIFFGVFWTYFHFSLTPSIFSGNIWPPEGIIFFFISENLWDNLRFVYLSGFYEYDYEKKFLYFYKGLIYFTDSENLLYGYLKLFFDLPVFYNISYNYFKDNYYNLYTLDSKYDNPIDFEKSIIYLNLYDKGALVNPYRIPLLNTVVLLTSGCILMWSHSCLRLRSYMRSIIGLGITIIFALFFIGCQAYEYAHAAFSINDGTFGSIFYFLTGLHGFHVIVGTIFLIVCFFRLIGAHFTSTNHFGFEAAIWYWHFVDVIWIFVYIFVYVWPSAYYFSDSWVEDNYFLNKIIYFHINFKDISSYIPIFDYNKNIFHDYKTKILLINYSIKNYITFMVISHRI